MLVRWNAITLASWVGKCPEPKKVKPNSFLLNYALVMSFILLTESYHMWTIGLGATNHITHDGDAFVLSNQYGVQMDMHGQQPRFKAKGIDTCELTLHGGCIFFSYTMSYIHRRFDETWFLFLFFLSYDII